MAIHTADERITTDEMQHLSSSTRTADTPPAAVDANNPRPRVPVGAPLAVGSVRDAPFHPSPSLDERHIMALENYKQFEVDMKPAVSALSVAADALRAVDKAFLQLVRDESKTPDQKLLVISGAAEKAHDRVNQTFVTANTKLSEVAAALEQQLRSPIQQKAALGSVNEEIRRHMKSLPRDERIGFLESAFKDDDSDTLTAILGAPHFLTGITKLEHAHYLRQLHEKRSPEAVKKLNITRAALAVLERTAPIALSSFEKAMRGTFKRAAELRGTANKAQKALDDVLAAITEARGG